MKSLATAALLLALSPLTQAAVTPAGNVVVTGKEVVASDWLVDPSPFKASASKSADGAVVTLENGLVRRVFRMSANTATVAIDNLMTGGSELRAIRPEASLTLGGKIIEVGGLSGQSVQNFLRADEAEKMTAKAGAFTCTGVTFGKTAERFAWKSANPAWSASKLPWPPPGVSATFTYAGPKGLEDIVVEVHYELYDGAPVMSKWLVVRNKGAKAVHLDSFTSEILSLVDTAPKIDSGNPHELRLLGTTAPAPKGYPDAPRDYVDRFTQMFVVTDYAFGGDMEAQKDNPGVRWIHDPQYEKTGIRYYGQYKPARVECTPPFGPDIDIPAGESWESFRAFELLRDSTERERRGLAEQRFWRLTAPWSQENPILMHVKSANPEDVRAAIDQAAAVGFEMVIMTFGSGFDIENRKPAFLAAMKELGDYAKNKGVALGGYSLLASRGGKPEDRIVSKVTGKPSTKREEGAHFGATPCLATDWGANYFATMKDYFVTTGQNVLENDGSYPGDTCAATTHSGHKGFEDSQWTQWTRIRDFYRWCAGNGVYLNVPDWYFLNGQNKTPMGYVETNWSLPRAQQEIIERQNIFDGTWEKTPTMGFMFVPLTQYHGGGAAATIEPLDEHRDHYGVRLANLFGSGVQACYRGPRLYDTDRTKELVKGWVDFYKANRAILDSPVIHLRRADGRDWDGLLHVNADLKTRGFAMLHNPLETPLERTIKLPLYYTGLTDRALVSIDDGAAQPATLARDYSVTVKVVIPARGHVKIFVGKP